MKEKGRTVAVIGDGGREAALVHKYSQSPQVGRILAIPGNDLMQINSKVPVITFPKLTTTDVKKIVNVCKKYKVDLVDVAQDDAIASGVTDQLTQLGFNVSGPTRAAGQIEWDKAWARDFMKKYKLPIPLYKIFNSQSKALQFIKKGPNKKWFIKAAGLARGKGVIPAENKKEAIEAIGQMSKFGKSGETFVIEEALVGEEFSVFAVSDSNTFQIIGCAQDHKRLYDGDLGPNTGGIGSVSPALIVSKNIYRQAERIIHQTLNGLKKDGRTYKGVLYLGAMVVAGKVFVIEFNARWGDPEAEVIVPGIKNDIFEMGMKIAQGKLGGFKIKTDGLVRVAVTGSSRSTIEVKKRKLFGLNESIKIKGVTAYGVRVSKIKGEYFALSGRLFHIVGAGKNITEARQKAYGAISLIHIEGNNLHYRTDIGWRDVERVARQKNT